MRYYCILTGDQLDTILPEEIREYMGYEQDYTMRKCIFGNIRETVNGDYLCECLLKSKEYFEEGCTKRLLHEEEVQMWRDLVGENNVFTDISNIELKEIAE